ncbi:MAG: UDP-2,3-diacylglucosamine diphosphatase LpxI [Candidatus Omnitrophica bacterium]|nr:UDP-2,3-diacylglucosamine diphosphatase LpxI [Candidatus Omnitrophota bacterium]
MKTLGLIAGKGRFPFLVAEEARQGGYRVVCCGIAGESDPGLTQVTDAYREIKLGQLGRLRDFFKAEGVREALMAGKIEKVQIFQGNVQPDLEMAKVLLKTRDFRDDALLGGIADYLASEGIELQDSTRFLKEAMPGPGVLGKKTPSKEAEEDMEFGWKIAKALGSLDIGQTVVVKNKAVLALEAIEGTDETIKRGGLLGRGGVTVVKTAKPRQDMRFDVPAVGLGTLGCLIEARAKALAFEAGKTIFIDLREFVKRADQVGIALVGR